MEGKLREGLLGAGEEGARMQEGSCPVLGQIRGVNLKGKELPWLGYCQANGRRKRTCPSRCARGCERGAPWEQEEHMESEVGGRGEGLGGAVLLFLCPSIQL